MRILAKAVVTSAHGSNAPGLAAPQDARSDITVGIKGPFQAQSYDHPFIFFYL